MTVFVGIPNNMSVLYDASCGKGVMIKEFPDVGQFGSNVGSGYAGGTADIPKASLTISSGINLLL